MEFLARRIARLEAWFGRRTAFLDRAHAPLLASVLVPVLFGLMSVALGQDDNWDLRNYHWYNPYALLHGRLHVDMAPAQWQSYFNPFIDVPYYLLNQALPGPGVGFVMGFVHGLNFVLLLAIARLALPPATGWRVCILLALAGVGGAGFLSEVGNSMGDNLSALFVLGALALVLRHWDALQAWPRRGVGTLLLAGFIMGVGAGLKLTNVTYAAALCVAMLAVAPSIGRGIGLAFNTGCGVLAGVALAAGPWWWRMWTTFGNPLFPQFNTVFKSPLARQLAVIDDTHLPHGVGEAAFWPFVFMRDFTRVSELAMKPLIMPALYLLALVFMLRWLFERREGRPHAPRLSGRHRFLLVFALAGYLAWLKLFSIYRYLIPIELLAPLLVWILLHRLAVPRVAGRVAGWILVLAALAVFPPGSWGHAAWGEQAMRAQLPPLDRPAATIVFTAHGNPPMGWLAAFVPPEARVIALGGGFPESPAYLARIQAAIASRPGPHYVLLGTARNDRENSLRRKLALANAFGMTADARHCARLDGWLHRIRTDVQVRTPGPDGQACTLELAPGYALDQAAADRAIVATAVQTLASYGLALDAAGCRRYEAAVGATRYPLQWCAVKSTVVPAQASAAPR